MKTHKNILVSIPTGDYAERLKLEGLLQFIRQKGGTWWNLRLAIGGTVSLSGILKRSPCYDGVIAYVQTVEERRKLLRLNVPTVLIEDLTEPANISRRNGVATILCDHLREGETAARYFLSRHHRNFAFVGTETPAEWSELRRRGFTDELARHGHTCAVFSGGQDLGRWLKALPAPCALLAARDLRARQVLDAAENEKIPVPQRLSVLGVDDDEILCKTAMPQLSSIPTWDRSLGYAAGRALNHILLGKSAGGLIRTRHACVVTRGSTDADVVDDRFVARALDWMRANLERTLTLKAVADGIGYSSRALDARFRQALGCSVADTAKRLKLECAESLLADGDLPIEVIAQRCGFSGTSHLCLRFRAYKGCTPLAFRKRAQQPD